ncbi:MAG: isoprenylcysteine carboxylmethyltransferase family protein [Acidobacteriota bacterium]
MTDLSGGLYAALLIAVALERVVELALTRRNAARLARRGGREVAVAHYRWMVLLHATFFVAAPLEVALLDRPLHAPLAATMLFVLGVTMTLRYWAIASLGDRWTTTVWIVPGEPPVTRGPYRWLRHPNYLAVILELPALALVHSAWWTALVYGVGNLLVLRARIPAEEAALRAHADYDAALGHVPGLPGLSTAAAEPESR